MKRLLFLAAALICLPPGYALGHSSLEGIGSFPNGLLHPILEPVHALCLAAGALLVAHQPAPRMPRSFLSVVIATALGLITTAFLPLSAATDRWLSTGLWSGCLMLGLLIAATQNRPYPFATVLLAAVFLLVGLDSGLENARVVERFVFAFGVWLGIALIVVNLTLACRKIERHLIAAVGMRIAGSWIAAAAAMMLAFTFRGA